MIIILRVRILPSAIGLLPDQVMLQTTHGANHVKKASDFNRHTLLTRPRKTGIIKMENEEIAEELKKDIDKRIEELSDIDYCEVLEEVASSCQMLADCKREELEREE